jgi:PIN domain nuclease of toxin-antitoxin system
LARGFLLDTHILAWWILHSARLSKAHAAGLADAEEAGAVLYISAVTLREIAMLFSRGRITMATSLEQSLADIEQHPRITVLPITAQIAVDSVSLGPGAPRDPSDQIIIATARCHGLRLMTEDATIRAYSGVTLA